MQTLAELFPSQYLSHLPFAEFGRITPQWLRPPGFFYSFFLEPFVSPKNRPFLFPPIRPSDIKRRDSWPPLCRPYEELPTFFILKNLLKQNKGFFLRKAVAQIFLT